MAAALAVGAALGLTPALSSASSAVAQQCAAPAAQHYGLDLRLVRAVLSQENGPDGRYMPNTDGSVDIGPMQINSIHLPELRPYGITAAKLLSDSCLNVYIGAWMLRREIDRAGDVWVGVGNYHSHTPSLHMKYRRLIEYRLQQIQMNDLQARR